MAIIGTQGPGEYGGVVFERDDGSTFVSFGEEAERLAQSFPAAPSPEELGAQVAAPPPQAPPQAQAPPLALYNAGAEPPPPAGPDLRTAQANAHAAAPNWQNLPSATPGGASKFDQYDAIRPPANAPAGLEQGVDNVLGTGKREIVGSIPRQGGAPGAPAGPPPREPPKTIATPGRPGISQAQLTSKAGQGVALPQAEVNETTGVIPRSPELDAAYYDTALDERLLREKQRNVDLQKLEADEQRYKTQRADLHNKELVANAETESHKLIAAQKVEHLKRYDTALQNKQIDPDKFFADRGAWSKVGAAVAVALGAYAAILGGGKNYAKEIIDDAVAADVDAQKEQYKRDKDARDNLVADLAREYGDIDEAAEAATIIKHAAALAHGRELAVSDGRVEVMRGFENFELEQRQKMNAREEALTARSIGNTTTRKTSAVAYPQAASGGGRRPLTHKEEAAWYKREADIAKAKGVISGGGEAALEPKDLHKSTVDYAKQRVKIEASRKAINRAVERIKEQEKHYGDDLLGVPGVGLVHMDRDLGAMVGAVGIKRGSDAAKNKQVLANALNLAVEANKGPASDQDVARKVAQVMGAGSLDEVRAGLADLANLTADQKKVLDAGYGGKVTGKFERQDRAAKEKALRAERDKPTAD